MRNQWLMSAAIAVMGMFVASGASASETIQLARMISPAAKTTAEDRASPSDHAQRPEAPTTIGQETLRHLIATISPNDTVSANDTDSARNASQSAKAKKAKRAKAKKKHLARKNHLHAQPEVLGNTALAPAMLKPCHHPVSPTPAFLLDAQHAPAASGNPAPWQHRSLRFGPK